MGIGGGSPVEGGIPVGDGLASSRMAGLRVRDAGSGLKSLLTSASLGDENSCKSNLVNHGSIRSRFVEGLSSSRPMVFFMERRSGTSLEILRPGGSLIPRFDCR